MKSRLLVGMVAIALVTSLLLAAPGDGKKAALVVGVKEYDSAHFPALRYTENDAEKLAEVLRADGFEVRLMTNARGGNDAPTAANVRAALDELVDGRKAKDLVLLALSGHGIQLTVDDPDEKGRPRGYGFFCPSDASLSSPVSYSTGRSAKLLSLSDVMAKLGACDAGSKFVLVDACRNEMKALAAARSVEPGAITVPPGVGALFSCKGGERSFEVERLGHGLFIHYVLDGLRGGAKNRRGEVTWTRLVAHVTDEVRANAAELVGGGARQAPFSSGVEVGDAVLLNAGKAEVLVPPKPDETVIENSIGMKLGTVWQITC